jgi:hypothetical protein
MCIAPPSVPAARSSIHVFYVILPTLTVTLTFGKLIVHGVKPTQVHKTGTLTRRCGDHVTLCISSDNHTTKHRYGLQCRTKWSEKLSVLDAQARRGLDKSVPNYTGRKTGLVGIVLLGSTQVVSTSEWTKSVPLLKKLLCTVNLSTVFVTEILWVWSSQDTHSSIPNAMFRLVDFPGHRLSHDVLDTVLVRQLQYNAHHKETVRIKKLKLK